MLRASPPLTVGQASHYYKSEFSRGDYYTERESEGIVASRWHGRGAEQLGLSGRVKAADFAHLLEGHDSCGEHVLVPHRDGLSERRAGWDVTISPHKSVTLAALVGGDKRSSRPTTGRWARPCPSLSVTPRRGCTGGVTWRRRASWWPRALGTRRVGLSTRSSTRTASF